MRQQLLRARRRAALSPGWQAIGSTLARGDNRDHDERDADGYDALEPGEDRSDRQQRDRDGHRPEDHLLLVISSALQRPLALIRTVREPSRNSLHERIDHRRLHLIAQFLASRDRRAELLLEHGVVAHDRIVWL